MASESAAHRTFTIPELVLLMSNLLDSRDLAHCTRVCKAWSRQLEPVLWTIFCLKENRVGLLNGKSSSPFMAALRRNLPHIRTLKACYTSTTLLQVLTGSYFEDPSTLCTNLRRLEFDDIFQYNRSCSQYLATLLDLNPQITHLLLPFESLGTIAVLVAVSKLDHLQHLTVYETERSRNVRGLLQILQACLPLPNLTELLLDLEFEWIEFVDVDSKLVTADSELGIIISEVRAIVAEASIARFSRNPTAAKIKSLRLPRTGDLDWNPLPLALLESDLLDLESFHIPWNEACEKASAFVRGCSGLRAFIADEFSDGSRTRGRIISTLVSHHSKTLEVLELHGCTKAESADQQMVLSRCKKLKRFSVLQTSQKHNEVGIESTHILMKKWVCMELKELGLTLNRFPKIDDMFLEEMEGREVDLEDEYDATNRLYALAAEIVYKQIGWLSKLEILVLDLHTGRETNGKEAECAWDLTLSRGWLRELAGLKRLKTLRLQVDFWSGMGQAEVEFMYEQWPLLNTIFFNADVSQRLTQSHWQWLCNKRPGLRYAR
ncbi:hypothetical protein EC968_009976 [Mortierella alpina]|nr:hypothetical protein EC968_009976 [Mortierella alpina]